MDTKLKNNYIYVRHGGKWVQEHRLVVEKFIGRNLKKSEVIHHIRIKEKTNNSINNLMIFPTQKEHASFHVYFAKYGWNQRTKRIIANRWKEYK